MDNLTDNNIVEDEEFAAETEAETPESEPEEAEDAETSAEESAEAEQQPAECEPSGETADDLTLCMAECTGEINAHIDEISANTEKLTEELREIRKLYHNEYAMRLRKVQEELDHYHSLEKGRLFDDILRETAHIYSSNLEVLEKIEDEKVKKQLTYMFSDILQLIESNGASVYKSAPGDPRNPRYCKVAEKIPTGDKSLHDTVARSISEGFYIENRPLVQELINVYTFDASLAAEPAENDMEE